MKEIIPVPSLGQQRRLKEIVELEKQIAQRIADLVRTLQEFRFLVSDLPAISTTSDNGSYV